MAGAGAPAPRGSRSGSAPTGSTCWRLRTTGRAIRNGVLDAATGAYVSDFELPPDVGIDDLAWEDDQHLLVSVHEGQARAILRVDLDGRITRAADGARVRRTTSPSSPDPLPRVCNLPPRFASWWRLDGGAQCTHGATHSPERG